MSRLDQQIGLVRSKLLLDRFSRGLAWSLVAVIGVAVIFLLVGKLFQWWMPHYQLAWLAGLAALLLAGGCYALSSPPSVRQAAVAIDHRLNLKEKFSTALYARPLTDPFAVAMVRDAELTADSVSLHNRFPLHFPARPAVFAAIAGMVLFAVWLLPNFDLAGVQATKQKKQELAHQDRVKAERVVKQAIVQIESAPKAVADTEAIKLAKQDLVELLKKPIESPALAQQKAEKALADMESVRQKIKDQQQYAQAQNQMKAFASMPPAADENTPISQAQNAMVKGNFSDAVEDIKSAVDKFDRMSQKQKDQTASDMGKLAQQMAQMANDPKVQQQMQKQLQQMGANQQQAQQIQQMMQQAANGDPKAQQQLQQAARQIAQQMNQKQGGSPQQQQQAAQQIQQAMQKMQQQANSQAQAQQMSQAAMQLAQAMQQASQASQAAKQGQQQQGAQQGSQQAKAGQGSQPGQSQQQSAQQQMAQAGQSMQQQMQQMQAMAKDAQAVAAGQQGGQQQGGQPGQNNPSNSGQQPGGNQGGQWAAGNPANRPGQGFGGPGQAAGARPDPEIAPFGVKAELSQSQTDEKGKVLASSFVKAGTVKGESKVGLASAVLNEQQNATDEVDEDRIPRSASKAVKDYFQTIKDDAK